MDEAALKPGHFSVELPEETEEVDEDIKRESDEYTSLAGHPAWLRLVENWKARILAYRQMSGVDVTSLKKEEIGEKWIVSNLVADEMEALIKTVEVNDTGK